LICLTSFRLMTKQLLFVLTLGLLWSLSLKGQTIFTDRPTVSTSPNTLPKRWFQLESGFQYQVRDVQSILTQPEGTNVESIDFNTTLLRYGLFDKFELRFTQNLTRTRLVNDGQTLVGGDLKLAPTAIGFKWNFLEAKGGIPKMALLLNYGNTILTQDDFGGFVETSLLFNSVLFKDYSVDYNIGFLMEDNINLDALNYSIVVARALSEKVSVFLESFGFFQEGLPDTISFDLGMAYLISNTFQADVYLGTGFSELSPNLLFGFGLSKLFLPKE